MNAKLAKHLRHAAGYRNQAATPGKLPFPGVFPRGRLFPLIEMREAIRLSSYTPFGGEMKCLEIKVKRIVHRGRFIRIGNYWGAEPVAKLKLNQKTGMYENEFDVMPVTKPARLDPQSPKGMYRALKKLERQHGIRALGKAIMGVADEAE